MSRKCCWSKNHGQSGKPRHSWDRSPLIRIWCGLRKLWCAPPSSTARRKLPCCVRFSARLPKVRLTKHWRWPGILSLSVYYRIWGDKGSNLGITSLDDAFRRLARNPSILADLDEILAWSQDTTEVSGQIPELPFACPLELHAQYGGKEIQAVFGRATLETAGQTGVGVVSFCRSQRPMCCWSPFRRPKKSSRRAPCMPITPSAGS